MSNPHGNIHSALPEMNENFFAELNQRVIIWEDSNGQDVAGKLPDNLNVAISTPAEATGLPIQGLADAHDAHIIDATHAGDDTLAHDGEAAPHADLVIDAHHAETAPMAGEPIHDDGTATA